MKKRRGYVNYRRRRRRKRAIIIAVVAVAALMTVGAVLLSRGAEEVKPVVETAKQAIRQQSMKSWEVIRGKNEYPNEPIDEGIEQEEDFDLNAYLAEEKITTVSINPSLIRGLEEHEGEKVLFDVQIFVGVSWAEEEKRLRLYDANEEAGKAEIFDYYNEVYEKWNQEVYIPLNKEMTAAEERGEEHAQGWWKHDVSQLFGEYWEESQTDTVKQRYTQAMEEAQKASDAYFAYEDSAEYVIQRNDALNAECKRLRDLGYDVNVRIDGGRINWYLDGLLTYDQLANFQKNDLLSGYEIKWREGQ